MKSIFFGNRDLGQLTEAEKQTHYENICEAAGLDPALNLLRYRMMDDGTGTGRQHLVLYATKAATDAIRGAQGISDLEQTEALIGTAYIVATKVQNKEGRTLIARGSVDIEGKRGRALENGIALAQTRSSRRAALAMSGLGLLDESELGDVIQNPVSDAPTPLPKVKQPAAKPNAAVGKDITAPAGLTLRQPPVSGKHVSAAEATPETDPVLIDPEPESEPARLPNPATGLKLAADNLAGPGLNRAGRTIEKPAVPAQVVAAAPVQVVAAPAEVISDASNIAPQAASEAQDVTTAPKKTRKKRTPKVVSTEETVTGISEEPTLVEAVVTELAKEPAARPVAAPGSKATVTTLATPNSEQAKVYVARLQELRDVTLKNTLTLSHGMGPVKKIRKFFSVVNNNIGEMNLDKLTVAQWESTFEFIDGALANGGPQALADAINYNIGAVDEPAAQ
jgi:hypothetical protein